MGQGGEAVEAAAGAGKRGYRAADVWGAES